MENPTQKLGITAKRASKLMGALTTSDLQMFAAFGVGQELLNLARIERVTDQEARTACALKAPADMDLSGILFPFYTPGNGAHATYCRIRRDAGQPKYLGPPKSENITPGPFFPPVSVELFNDKAVPVLLCEAEKSCLAIWAWCARTGRKLLPVATGGAWGWSCVVGTKEIKGQTVEVHGLHPDLAALCANRKTFVLLDANALTNADVQKARQRLTAELRNIGALPHVLDLPTGDWNGPDDYIAAAGDQALADLFNDQRTGDLILNDVAQFIKKFMVLSEAQVTAVALWISHTWAIDACQFTPYLAITSAEKRCGKSRLLEILEYLVREPWMTSGATAPALFRRIDAKRPCLLLDEIDALVKGSPEMAEAVRGVLNAGNKAGATISRCVGKGTEMLVKDFVAFCPKAVSGIGNLPDTVRDRSLPIRLQRKLSAEQVARLRARLVKPEAGPLRERLKNWVEAQVPQLEDARPAMPEELDDRQQDGAEILFALADAAGGSWPARCRAALLALFRSVDSADDSARLRLLADLRTIFTDLPLAEGFSTSELLEKLKDIETSPWADWHRGKGLSPKGLSDLLKPYGIFPGQFREKGDRNRGYRKADLEDAWSRYLPPLSVTSQNNPSTCATTNVYAASEAIFNPSQTPECLGLKSDVSINENAAPAQVLDLNSEISLPAPEPTPENGANGTTTLPEPAPLPASDMLAESEAIRRHFQEQETAWRADPHAPPVMPDTRGMLPFLTAAQIALSDDRQIVYGDPPDLRPGRGCDVGMADDEHRKRKDYWQSRRGIR